MPLKKLIKLLFLFLFTLVLSGTANASMIEYTYSYTLDASGLDDSYGLNDTETVGIEFIIDTDQGYTDSGLSMHTPGNDSEFTMSLSLNSYLYDGDDDLYSANYPVVTLNASDGSVNTIDYIIYAPELESLFIIEAATIGGPTTMTAGFYDNYDINNDGVLSDEEIQAIISALDDKNNSVTDIVSEWGISTIETGSNGDWSTNTIPEPATFSLFGLGLLGWAWFSRRKSLE